MPNFLGLDFNWQYFYTQVKTIDAVIITG